MSKKKGLLILLAILCVIVVLSYTLFKYKYETVQDTNASGSPSNPPPTEGPELVIPETPFGILGLTSALAIAYVIFLLVKKKLAIRIK